MNLLDMTVKYIWWWGSSTGAWEIWSTFHCYYSKVHSDPEWLYLLGSHLWVKWNGSIIYEGLLLLLLLLLLFRPLLGRLVFVSDGVSKSMADSRPKGPQFRLGHIWVSELLFWHLCTLCIALDLTVSFKVYSDIRSRI